jgi:hypothetical protein
MMAELKFANDLWGAHRIGGYIKYAYCIRK